jgi:magnesium chelatase family protein
VLEALRQPLEEGRVTISRAARTASFPARFMLVAAMNPCPCGFFGDRRRVCRCSEPQILRYAGRISGPLRDRIDLVVEVPATASHARDAGADGTEPSSAIRLRVLAARARQRARFGAAAGKLNRELEGLEIDEHCRLDTRTNSLLDTAIERFGLSTRSSSRLLRVSRTIADLADSNAIRCEHVAEALQYRFNESSPGLRLP